MISLKRRYTDLKAKIWFWILIKCARVYSEKYMDQWEQVQFDTKFGPVYVDIMRSTPYSHDYHKVT